jgi:hypothetical protein
MSTPFMQNPPSTARLLKATAAAITLAAVVLVAFVLPAEYGIDPTGIGKRLGLDVLASAQTMEAQPEPGKAKPQAAAAATPEAPADAANAELARISHATFGEEPGQSFDAASVIRGTAPQLRDAMTVTIAPRKGMEVKAPLQAGEAMVFHWTASGDVSFDMHGDRRDAGKDEYTSYWVEPAQREASGTLTAPFDGNHGWFWVNRGDEPVTVELQVAGFQDKLFVPGHN